MVDRVPPSLREGLRGMVCAADQRAALAGISMIQRGGSAADAAVAAGTVMAVTSPHMCGLGGDMLAMVATPSGPPMALLGVGRAGDGVRAQDLRGEGHRTMPLRRDLRSVTVPGAVDGWLALHSRFGRLGIEEVLAPALFLARDGFSPSQLLTFASALVVDVAGAQDLVPDGPLQGGERIRLPALARTLEAIGRGGRDAFYGGEFGHALRAMGDGLYAAQDLARPLAEWTEPLSLEVFGHRAYTVPPPSQGYLSLAGAWVAEHVGVPSDPEDPLYFHLLVEAARAVGHDRPAVLADRVDGSSLLSEQRLTRALDRIDHARAAPSDIDDATASALAPTLGDGDTTHLCVLDEEGLGISMTQSNALDFGSHLVAGGTGVFLHNRGLGFSLEPGHIAELTAGRRPPHTLSPALVTRRDGSLSHLVGTMGGDAQPQIIMQLLARLLGQGAEPRQALAAPRFALDAPSAGPFRLWFGHDLQVRLEGHAPGGALRALADRGHHVIELDAFEVVSVGHAHIISTERVKSSHRIMRGASDPRSLESDAIGC